MRAGIPVNEDYRAPRTLAHKVDAQSVHGNKLAEVLSSYMLIGFTIGIDSLFKLAFDVFLVHIHPIGGQWVAALRSTGGDPCFDFGGQLKVRLIAPNGPPNLPCDQIRRTVGRNGLNECPYKMRG